MMMNLQEEPAKSPAEAAPSSTLKKVRFETSHGPEIKLAGPAEPPKPTGFQGNRLHQKSARTLHTVTAKPKGNSRNSEPKKKSKMKTSQSSDIQNYMNRFSNEAKNPI